MQINTLTNYEMRDRLAAAIKDAGSASLFALDHGVQVAHIAKVLTGNCPPCKRLEMALGVRSSIRYEIVDSAAPIRHISTGQHIAPQRQPAPIGQRKMVCA